MSTVKSGLVRYDAMCRAIEAAHEVDEVKDIKDKARAIEVYARQAKNTTAEAQACRIRLRAKRRMGELTAQMEKAKTGPKSELSPACGKISKTQTLAKIGLTSQEV